MLPDPCPARRRRSAKQGCCLAFRYLTNATPARNNPLRFRRCFALT
jgi:hypothetical protein